MQDKKENEIYRYYVVVFGASNLIAADFLGKSDPYCIVRMGDSTEQKTGVINQDLNPRWNKQFVFISEKPEPFLFELYDWDSAKSHDFLGNVHVSAEQLFEYARSAGTSAVKKSFSLSGVKTGSLEVEISIRSYPFDRVSKNLKLEQAKNAELQKQIESLKSKLTDSEQRGPSPVKEDLEVKEVEVAASNDVSMYREMYRFELNILRGWRIAAAAFDGTSNSFVQVHTEKEGESLAQQTPCIPSTTDPYYNHKMVFTTDTPEKFFFSVIDHGFLGIKKVLGTAEYDGTKILESSADSGTKLLSLPLTPQGTLELQLTYFKLCTR